MSLPLKDCEVRHDDGAWYPGLLLDWQRRGQRWHAVVRYRTAPGMQYQRGVDQDHVRPVDNPSPAP